MTKYEIVQEILELENDVKVEKNQIAVAEGKITELSTLKSYCVGYQEQFEKSKLKRKTRLEEFRNISGQANLINKYSGTMLDALDGYEYINASNNLESAKSVIEYEIVLQRETINRCNIELSKLYSSINSKKQELMDLEEE